jgi:hypothetical protein
VTEWTNVGEWQLRQIATILISNSPLIGDRTLAVLKRIESNTGPMSAGDRESVRAIVGLYVGHAVTLLHDDDGKLIEIAGEVGTFRRTSGSGRWTAVRDEEKKR